MYVKLKQIRWKVQKWVGKNFTFSKATKSRSCTKLQEFKESIWSENKFYNAIVKIAIVVCDENGFGRSLFTRGR